MSLVINNRSDISGLRAVAVLAVIFFHLDRDWLPGGFTGVDIFFVISGYLITKIIISEVYNNKFSFLKFYTRRIRRIFPALFFVMFTSLIFACVSLTEADMELYAKTLLFSSLQVSNIFFQSETNYFDPVYETTPLLHTWSLGVEEQFYLILPVTVFLFFKLSTNRKFLFGLLSILSILSMILSEYLLNSNPQVAFYSLPSRFFELGIGSLLAFHLIPVASRLLSEMLSLLGLSLVIYSICFLESENFPGINALIPCLGTGLLIFANHASSTFVSKLLSNRVFVFIGLISYSLYLWHWPIIAFYKYVSSVVELSYMEALSIVLLSFVLAVLSWKFIEEPFRGTSRSDKGSMGAIDLRVIISGVLLASLFSLIALHISLSGGWSWRFINAPERYDNHEFLSKRTAIQKLTDYEQCHIYDEKTFNQGFRLPENLDECVIGGNNSKIDVVLIGDSHGAHYSTAIIDFSRRHGMSILLMTAGGCSVFVSNSEYCSSYADKINSILNSYGKNLKYIFVANDFSYIFPLNSSQAALDGIRDVSTKYSNSKVVLLGTVPKINLSAYDEKKPYYYTKSSKEVENNFLLESLASSASNIYYFNPALYLCRYKDCKVVEAKNLLYADNDHLNIYGSRYLAQFMDFNE
jgi:peptidoglycan/LPS O-acetylase OafA/YrhL